MDILHDVIDYLVDRIFDSTKEGKQRLIDGFIKAIYLYDDKITFTFNYKDGTKTVFLSELNCTPSGSDLKCLGAPKSRII